MNSMCRKFLLSLAILFCPPGGLTAVKDYGDDFLIDPGKRHCYFKELEAKLYGGLVIDSQNVSDMGSYTIKEFHVPQMQCAVARLQADEVEFRWVQDCPSGETVHSHFVLSNPWVNKSTMYQKSHCYVYEQSSRMIQMVNKSWNQCNVTCTADLKNQLKQLNLNISFSILLKIVPHQVPRSLHILKALGCAYYFRFIEILFTVGAVLLVIFYVVWLKLCYKCHKSDVPVAEPPKTKSSLMMAFNPVP